MKHILITGGLGHIGSKCLRDLFAGEPVEVTVLDNLVTSRYCSLFDLPRRVRFIEGDICTADLDPIVRGNDVVLHLAAITDAESSVNRAEEVERVNVTGTVRVAEACLRHQAGLCFISTTSVYGVQNGIVDETCSAEQLRPQSPYAESKLSSERLLQSLGKQGLRYAIFRFGTIYGVSPGMRFHTAVNKFVWQACNGLPLTVWRTAAKQVRPYLAIEDATRAIEFLIARDLFSKAIYNVVTENTSVENIVELIRQRLPDTAVAYVDSPIMNQLSYEVASDRLREAGFAFSGSIDRGIDDTIRLLRGIRSR